ncbi:MAG: cytochrome P450 [Planctomycetota bacterium]
MRLPPEVPASSSAGHAENMTPDRIREFLHDTRKVFGDVFSVNASGQKLTYVFDADILHHIWVANSENYTRRPSVNGAAAMFPGLFMDLTPGFRRKRRLLEPIACPATIDSMHRHFVSSTIRAINPTKDVWQIASETGQVRCCHSDMRNLGFELAVETFLGIELSNTERENAKQACSHLVKFGYGATFESDGHGGSMSQEERVLRDIVLRTVAEKRASPGQDFVSLMLRFREPLAGDRLDTAELVNEIFSALWASAETIGNVLGFMWQFLAENPSVISRACEEVDRVLGGRVPAVEDVQALPYCMQVAQETLRRRPTAWIAGKLPMEDDVVSGFLFRRDEPIWTSIYEVHHHERYWADASKFDPDRFLPESSGKRHRFCYLPFGGGTRKCIAERLVPMQMQLVLATLLQKFDLRLADPQDPGLEFHTVISVKRKFPNVKLWLRAESPNRNSSLQKERSCAPSIATLTS